MRPFFFLPLMVVTLALILAQPMPSLAQTIMDKDKKTETAKPEKNKSETKSEKTAQKKAEEEFNEEVTPDAPCTLPEALCGDKPKFGTYWNNLSDAERKWILRGFDVGLSAAWQASYLEGGDAGSVRSGILDRRLNISETYAGIGIDAMVTYFNNFYADAKNDTIDWSYAWLLASLAYQEKNERDRPDHDERFLKNFLQTYGELPGWVRIIDVKDVDLIEVEVLVPEPYHLLVKLRGVTSKTVDGTEMTRDQKERAVRFIKGLAATRGYPFKGCGCTEMVRPQLYYGANLFTGSGTLEAYVRISESNFCLLKDEVFSGNLIGASTDNSFVLNEVMLASGLAYMDDESSDYQESDRLMQSIDVARDKGYNIYGRAKLPPIEKIIKQGPKPLNQNCVP